MGLRLNKHDEAFKLVAPRILHETEYSIKRLKFTDGIPVYW